MMPKCADGIVYTLSARKLSPSLIRGYIHAFISIGGIQNKMELAAGSGQCYHLWWHPHNFGQNMIKKFALLDTVISCCTCCRDEYGKDHRNMRDLAELTP
jgi:hypothetical protein